MAVQTEGNRPYRRVFGSIPTPWALRDNRQTRVDLKNAVAEAEDFARQPFDLERGPLLRVLVIQYGDDEFLLVLAIHHLIVDGHSLRRLIGEIGDNYVSLRSHQLPESSPSPIQAADLAFWERHTRPSLFQAQIDYWKRQLDGQTEPASSPHRITLAPLGNLTKEQTFP